ncbi:dCMP deaminase [Pectobacterium bacteriophage PM2]|uniref:Deoxycytidylate deaminase n=1 Tax=Pectobacterium bacteriophage PM2 TaxID=1429794 RepID=A0A0A0Q3L3_9CAUD|nr:dCMP deaminase [Pectobacterium bacteriophage PM2]AHY25197.1 deoxycytidylate deaminase [Pectobacterium bacteriophage PM2]
MKAGTYLQIAYLISQESKCCSWKVGAVIEKDGRIISTGYNGSPAGGTNCCDHAEEKGWLKSVKITGPNNTGYSVLAKEHRPAHSEWSAKNEIHAELNSILFAARKGVSIEGATLYTTASPCPECTKAISQSGIKKVVYAEFYDRSPKDWADILTQAGIEVIEYSRNNLRSLNWDNIRTFCGE